MKNDHKRKQQWGKGIDSWGLGFTPVPHCLSSLLLFLNCLAFFSRPGLLASLLSWHGGKTKWIQHAPFFIVKQHCKKTLGTDVSSFYVKSTYTPLLLATALFFLEYPCRPVTLPLEPSMTNTFNIALYNWLPPFVVPLFNQGLHTLETKSKRKKKPKPKTQKKRDSFSFLFLFIFSTTSPISPFMKIVQCVPPQPTEIDRHYEDGVEGEANNGGGPRITHEAWAGTWDGHAGLFFFEGPTIHGFHKSKNNPNCSFSFSFFRREKDPHIGTNDNSKELTKLAAWLLLCLFALLLEWKRQGAKQTLLFVRECSNDSLAERGKNVIIKREKGNFWST